MAPKNCAPKEKAKSAVSLFPWGFPASTYTSPPATSNLNGKNQIGNPRTRKLQALGDRGLFGQ